MVNSKQLTKALNAAKDGKEAIKVVNKQFKDSANIPVSSLFLEKLNKNLFDSEEVINKIESVQAGDNILIDVTDPKNPIITAEGGIEGTNYIFVAADGTDVENALALQAAYDEAKTLSPSGTNRITIIAAPGYYNFGTNPFEMDTQFIDLVSLDGNRSVIFNSSNANGTISITANFVYVKGVDVLTKNFIIGNGLGLLKIENCKGGNNSFGGDATFGSNPLVVSGTFINCEGGSGSFGSYGTASGTFTNCTGGDASFGTFGTALGTFNNCNSGSSSFGTAGTASGTFNNCIANNNSFGVSGTLSGKLYYCRLIAGAFPTPTGNGKIVLGIDGNDDVINL